jgi:hypothetical protein
MRRDDRLSRFSNRLVGVAAEPVVRHVGINSRAATGSISPAGSHQTPE